MRNPIHCLAFGFGSGLSPKMPGTVGTVAAIPLYWLLAPLSLWPYLAIIVVSFVVGIYLCDRTSKDLEVDDHPGIVWDEFVGFWITMLAVPQHWGWVLWGFLWFRVFDILKPWPIRWFDRNLHGGFGIMIDDVLAGIMALLVMQLSLFLVT